MIHPTAIIDKKAQIAPDVEIGPNVVIEGDVKISAGVKVWANAYITGNTEIGPNCEVHMGAVLGHLPQDLAYEGGESFLKIGESNVFREYSNVHRGTKPGSATIIGNNNYIMGFVHIAHNCRIGNNVIMTNGALLAGYTEVGDSAFCSGNVAVHQFTKIGRLAMLAGLSRVNKDVPPFMMLKGDSEIVGINRVGLRRAGISREGMKEITQAYKLLYRSGLNVSQAVEEIKKLSQCQEVLELLDFIKGSKRGLCTHAPVNRGEK